MLLRHGSIGARRRDENGTDRRVFGAAARPRKARGADGDIRAKNPPSAFRHRPRCRLGDRAVLGEDFARNAEKLCLDFVGIGDYPAFDVFAASGHIGQSARDEPARTGFRRRHGETARFQFTTDDFLHFFVICAVNEAAEPRANLVFHRRDQRFRRRLAFRLCRNADDYARWANQERQRRILLRQDQVVDFRFQHGLADAVSMQNPRIDNRRNAVFFHQVGREAPLEHVLHFRRRPRQIDEQLAVPLHRDARRGARVIDEDMRTLRNHRLPQIVFRHLTPDTSEMLFEPRHASLVLCHFPAHDLRRDFLRDIAPSRPQAPGGDHEVGAGQSVDEDFLHTDTVVAHRRLKADVDSHPVQLPRHIRGVRVDDLPEEQLTPRRHKLRNHILPSL